MAKKVKNQNESSKQLEVSNIEDVTNEKTKIKKRKKLVNFTEETIDNSQDEVPAKKKKKNKKVDVVIKAGIPTEEELTECNKLENKKSTISKRQQKKEKYNKFLETQKIESQINSQQKNLNYLSQWKHNRSQWKFEKLKQSWLQKHMYESELIPDEHWTTVVEYFSGSKGHVRQVILKECMEVVEKYDALTSEDENQTEISESKFKRARNMLQSLEE